MNILSLVSHNTVDVSESQEKLETHQNASTVGVRCLVQLDNPLPINSGQLWLYTEDRDLPT